MTIKVMNEIEVYEIDGYELKKDDQYRKVKVDSHESIDSFVILEFGNKRFTVKARDLEAAIKNATNVNRHG